MPEKEKNKNGSRCVRDSFWELAEKQREKERKRVNRGKPLILHRTHYYVFPFFRNFFCWFNFFSFKICFLFIVHRQIYKVVIVGWNITIHVFYMQLRLPHLLWYFASYFLLISKSIQVFFSLFQIEPFLLSRY
jgi:hypothetical protein